MLKVSLFPFLFRKLPGYQNDRNRIPLSRRVVVDLFTTVSPPAVFGKSNDNGFIGTDAHIGPAFFPGCFGDTRGTGNPSPTKRQKIKPTHDGNLFAVPAVR